MNKYVLSIIIWISIYGYSIATPEASLPLHSSNDIQITESGWMKITGGDPYLVYRSDPTAIHSVKSLNVLLQGNSIINRHSYTELFWATDTHGFSEAYKGFYISKYGVTPENCITHALNFGSFITAMDENGTNLSLIRIDLEPSLGNSEFTFKCKVSVGNNDYADRLIRKVKLHPPYQSRYLYKPSIVAYVLKCIPGEVFGKITRDWVFLVMYAGAFATTAGILIWILKRHNPWAKPEETEISKEKTDSI